MKTVPFLTEIMILHIDMDAFFASIEQAINPRLKGKPLIVGSRNNRLHTVVCAASYEAKAYGIRSGMPSKEAFQLCPNLKFVAADQSKYIWTSERILEMLKGYGYEVDYASIDEFRVDLREQNNPLAVAKKMQKNIQDSFNITASIGIAKNCLLAKLASKIKKPNGITIITEGNAAGVLNKTPIEKLCGVGEKSTLILNKLGIKTCVDLYNKPQDFLEEKLGKNGLNFYLDLHSEEKLELEQKDSPPKSIGHSYTFPRTTENPGFIKAWLRLLSEMVSRRLRSKNLTSATVHLWLNNQNATGFSTQRTFRQATNDGYEIYRRCLKIMEISGLKTPKIRALGVTCSSLSRSDYLPLLNEEKRREDLIKALDRINTRFGEDSIHPAVTILTRKMS